MPSGDEKQQVSESASRLGFSWPFQFTNVAAASRLKEKMEQGIGSAH
jgi:hypothetical protein